MHPTNRENRHPFESRSWPTHAERADRSSPLSASNVEVAWAGNHFPLIGFPEHALALGMTGSGKTNLLKMFLHSLLPVLQSDERRVAERSDPPYPLRYRAILTDPKEELVPFFYRMGFTTDDYVVVTNPYDTRCSAWDVAGDLTTDTQVFSFANALCPLPDKRSYDKEDKVFWRQVAHVTIRNIIEAFNQEAPFNWSLWDLVNACTEKDHLEALLKLTPQGTDTYKAYYTDDPKLRAHCWGSVFSEFIHLQVPSMFWRHAKTTFSMRKWMELGSLLLLGCPLGSPELVQPLNRLIARYAFQNCLNRHRPEEVATADMSWFVLDELSTVGDFPKLREGLKTGRSKGVRILLADQDKASMRRVFGPEDTTALYAQCRSKIFLATESAEEAEEAAKEFGQSEQDTTSTTYQSGGGYSRSVSKQRKHVIDPRRFMTLKRAVDMDEDGNEGGFECFLTYNGTAVTSPIQTGAAAVTAAMPHRSSHFEKLPEGLEQLPENQHPRYEKWDSEDLIRLGLKAKPTSVALRWSEHNPITLPKNSEN